jgi:hypothetical protein
MFRSAIWLAVLYTILGPAHLDPQGVSVIEVADIQVARTLSAGISDHAHSPIEGALVEEMSPNWETRLRNTRTDSKGRFTLTTVKGRRVCYFKIMRDGFDPLRIRVRVDTKRGTDLQLQMIRAT